MSPQTSRWSRSRPQAVSGSPRLGLLVVAMLFMVWVSMPASALAEECGDTTIAYGTLNWEEGSEWSDRHPPTESEIACIPNTVSSMRIISNATAKALRDEATPLWIEGSSTLDLTGASSDSSIYKLGMYKGTLAISGYLSITHEMVLSEYSTNEIEGHGEIVTGKNVVSKLEGTPTLAESKFVNEGATTLSADLLMTKGAQIVNFGTFAVTPSDEKEKPYPIEAGEGSSSIVNRGLFEKTVGYKEGVTTVAVPFSNQGTVKVLPGDGRFDFLDATTVELPIEWGPAGNPSSSPGHNSCHSADPITCATGNFSESQADLSIGGRGVGLDLTRTYNSQAAVAASSPGPFGYGWTSSFSEHLVVEKTAHKATLYQATGSTVVFTESEGKFTAPNWTQDTLSGTSESGYTLTMANQTKYKFNGTTGKLESVTDRNGNATTLAYNGSGRLETITDPASRKITLAYNGEGLVESAKDPMGHVVKYTYESGNLTSVTEPGEEKTRWKFEYNGSHEITTMTDGRGGKTVNEYNGSNQVIAQTDPAERKLTFEYEPLYTKITNVNTGTVTEEFLTSSGEPSSITRGAGTSSETTEEFIYNEGGQETAVIDGSGHKTVYGYDSAGDRTFEINPDSDETKWTYDSAHDVEKVTTPKGETTTYKRNSDGDPETVERPAPGSKTQITKYKYGSHGEVESMTDPLEHTWKYEYDTKGDRTAEIDPEGNKRTWEYNEDSRVTATVSPRGNVKGAEASKFTTKIERDAQGRVLKITDPLGHTTKYTYDGNGNVETVTDGNSHTTTYKYNADNQQIAVKEPNGTLTETEYDGAGQVIAQIDGNKHTTKYVRNALERVVEVVNPLSRTTYEEYDKAGNLVSVTDPMGRTTTNTYDPANRLTKISYSEEGAHAVEYEYDQDGDRLKMIDGSGTTTYTYDQLDRLTETENGHKEKVKYEYNLGNEQAKITYPNTKAVTRAYDKDDRLEKVTDWSSHSTKFAYDPDSDVTTITFPSETKDEDKYTFNDADQIAEAKMVKSTETLASLVYTLDNDGQVKKVVSKGLPGEETTEYTYDENNRLTKAGSTAYEYDAANNPTKIGSSTYTYDSADELEKGTGLTYSFNEDGERIKTTPSGAATTYGYNQAGDLTSVERPEEGKTAAIKDTYAFNGDGLRVSETISGTTNYLAWDLAEGLPSILSNGTYSYIYGPGGLPVEQINSAGKAYYLHHDEQGSTRLLTGSTGKTEATMTFSPYGSETGSTGSITTRLGYDGQYTSPDSGLIYMQARVYDPATAQFLSVDPLTALTGEPYAYASDNPLNNIDPSGFEAIPIPIDGPEAPACLTPETIGPCAVVGGGGYVIVEGVKSIVNAWAGEEAGNDEGEAFIKQSQAEEAAKESEQACEPTPPGYDPETWTKGPASRPKEPNENYYDPEGGEWHYHAPDRHHDVPHWDYKRLPGKLAPWDEIPIE